MKALVCILSATQAFFLNSPLADIFKFNPNYLENEEKYKAIKVDIGKAHPTMSQVQRNAIARMMTKVCLEQLIPYLVHD